MSTRQRCLKEQSLTGVDLSGWDYSEAQKYSGVFLGEKWIFKEVEDQSQDFISTYCNGWSLGLSKAKKHTKNKQRKPPSLHLEVHGKNLILAVISKWKVSQQSNFPWLSRASKCTWKLRSSLSLSFVNTASLNSPTGTVVFHQNRALLDLVIGVERAVSCVETPWYSQRSCDFPESTKNLKVFWMIHFKALAPILEASTFSRV